MNYLSIKKYIFLLIAIVLMGGSVMAQETAEEYKATKEGWLVKMDEAYKISKETGKPIMANFTGSDWCGWCKKLDKSVFNTAEFKAWAEKNVVLLELDFPRRTQIPNEIKQQNNSLKGAFKVRGFPSVWVFDLDQDAETQQFNISALGKTGYTKTAKEFIEGVDAMIAQRG